MFFYFYKLIKNMFSSIINFDFLNIFLKINYFGLIIFDQFLAFSFLDFQSLIAQTQEL